MHYGGILNFLQNTFLYLRKDFPLQNASHIFHVSLRPETTTKQNRKAFLLSEMIKYIINTNPLRNIHFGKHHSVNSELLTTICNIVHSVNIVLIQIYKIKIVYSHYKKKNKNSNFSLKTLMLCSYTNNFCIVFMNLSDLNIAKYPPFSS